MSEFPCYVNSNVFYAWPTQGLLPKWSVSALIVMDNVTFHKRNGMLRTIKEKGCMAEIFYLLTA